MALLISPFDLSLKRSLVNTNGSIITYHQWYQGFTYSFLRAGIYYDLITLHVLKILFFNLTPIIILVLILILFMS